MFRTSARGDSRARAGEGAHDPPRLPATSAEADAENELLAQLGLPQRAPRPRTWTTSTRP